jgi:hypothetical protein
MADASVDGAGDDPSHTVAHGSDYPFGLTFDLSGLAAAITDAKGNCRPK